MPTTHTPGPWIVSPTKHRTLIVSELGFHVAATEEVSDPDARLIAAAPAMLAALQTLVRAIDRLPGNNPLDGLADEARAAIARATGDAA